MRQWISIRGPGGVRMGQSWGPEDRGPPKLPSWRRYELRKQLQTAATAKGKSMTIADCDYVIDRTLEIATVDKNGLVLHLRGNRDKLINELSEILGFWSYHATPGEAARLVDKAIARRSRPWVWLGAAIAKQTKPHPSAVDGSDMAVKIIEAVAQLFQRRQKHGELFAGHRYVRFNHLPSPKI